MNKKALSVMTMSGLAWLGSGHAEVLGCLIEPDRVADVGSQSTGVIEKLLIERGDAVAAGQVLAKLSAQVEKASVSVAETKAKAEAEAMQAQAAFELAQRKLDRTRDLVKRDFVSDQALDQAEAEARVAQQRVEQAREAQRVAHKEYMLSNAQLSQREVRSPFAGVVVERYRTEGERVEREPVARVARLDPLRVEAIVPASQFGSVKSGQQATIKTDLPDFPVLTAQVTLVDRVVDPASNSFRVRLTVPNPGNRIPSGLRCRLALDGANGATQGMGAPKSGPAARNVPNPSVTAPVSPVAPTTWPRPEQPVGEARVMTVSYGNKPAMPVQPAVPVPEFSSRRLVSSTLKMAMSELGRATPGGHFLPAPDGVPAVATVPATRAIKPKVFAMATSFKLPTLGAPIGGPIVASVKHTSPAVADNRSEPVSGYRVASVR